MLRQIPVLRLLGTPLAELRQRAEALAMKLRALEGIFSVQVADDVAYVGGGSLPDQTMKTCVVEVQPRDVSDEDLAQRLRTGDPAVVGRLRDGRLVLDLRTIFADQEAELVEALCRALTGKPNLSISQASRERERPE